MVSKGKVKYKLVWRLAALLGERKLFNYAELQRMLKDVGVDISSVQVGRLVRGEPEKYNRELLEGLMSVLDCTLDELIATTVVSEDESQPTEEGVTSGPVHNSPAASKTTQAETTGAKQKNGKAGKIQDNLPVSEFERIAGPKLVPFPPPKRPTER